MRTGWHNRAARGRTERIKPGTAARESGWTAVSFLVSFIHVHDAIVADADAQPAVLPSRCLYAVRSGLSAQGFGGVLDAARYLTVKLAELPQRGRRRRALGQTKDILDV
jgi:hypothetical protein